ncbi:sugar ABC transporter permease, partial [Paenibacillus sp. MCAF20]
MQAETTSQAVPNLIHPKKKSRLANVWTELKKNKHYYFLMSPYILIFFTFTVIPVVFSLILSFFYFNMLEFPRFVGWQNYSRLFLNDDIFMIAVKNTF